MDSALVDSRRSPLLSSSRGYTLSSFLDFSDFGVVEASLTHVLRSSPQAEAIRSQASLTSRSPARPDPNSVGGLIHPTTEVTPLEGTTAR